MERAGDSARGLGVSGSHHCSLKVTIYESIDRDKVHLKLLIYDRLYIIKIFFRKILTPEVGDIAVRNILDSICFLRHIFYYILFYYGIFFY